MDVDFVVNQTAWMLSKLTPTALREISKSIMLMVEDSMELTEITTDPATIKMLINNVLIETDKDD